MGGANDPKLATVTVRVSCARDEAILAREAPLGGADRRT
jgi:hypothetical protein